MIHRTRIFASVSGIEDVTEELEELYEQYPDLRGKTPNHIVNLAWKEFIKQKLPNKVVKKVSNGSFVKPGYDFYVLKSPSQAMMCNAGETGVLCG